MGSSQQRGMMRAGTSSAPTSFGGSNVIRTQARPYHPLFSSPDRLQLPVQLAQLNQYWRLFYNVDPIIGGVIDMHGDMPWSDARLSMDESGDNPKEILQAYEDMMTETELLSWLPRLTREYMIIGEVFPYMFWDEEEGIWNHITLHNPDYIEVIDSPLIDDDPILTLRPSQEMRRILQSTDPRYVRLRQKLPSEIIQLLVGGKNLPLDNLNASHMARRAFPYDIRGTSIMGRMFRILMYEDAVFNGQIQQAQRHALPLRVFKLGDPNTGWIPTTQNQEDFAQLLAEVEVDPLAAIIYHYGLQVEYHGMEGKQLKLTQEWDIIEKAKLVALGVSKAFLHGEVTYASANAGLQILMMRYKTLRNMVVNDWIYKKVFATMAELRGFYRDIKKSDDEYGLPESRTPSLEKQSAILKEKLQRIKEIDDPNRQAYEFLQIQPVLNEYNAEISSRKIPMHRIAGGETSKVNKRKRLLYPNLQFEKRLDVRQDENILTFWMSMAEKGWISPRSVVQGSGLDYDSEQSTIAQDINKIVRNSLLAQQVGGGAEGGGGAAGGVGVAPPAGEEGQEGGVGVGAPGEGGQTPPGGAGGETPSAATKEAPFTKQAAKDDSDNPEDKPVVPFDKTINFIEDKEEKPKPKTAVEALIEREIDSLDKRTDLFVTGK
jgi:hypothetical protein